MCGIIRSFLKFFCGLLLKLYCRLGLCSTPHFVILKEYAKEINFCYGFVTTVIYMSYIILVDHPKYQTGVTDLIKHKCYFASIYGCFYWLTILFQISLTRNIFTEPFGLHWGWWSIKIPETEIYDNSSCQDSPGGN